MPGANLLPLPISIIEIRFDDMVPASVMKISQEGPQVSTQEK
jgi:hypothetical protein